MTVERYYVEGSFSNLTLKRTRTGEIQRGARVEMIKDTSGRLIDFMNLSVRNEVGSVLVCNRKYDEGNTGGMHEFFDMLLNGEEVAIEF